MVNYIFRDRYTTYEKYQAVWEGAIGNGMKCLSCRKFNNLEPFLTTNRGVLYQGDCLDRHHIKRRLAEEFGIFLGKTPSFNLSDIFYPIEV